tara:strand:+ start:492 stop:1046 length:555 start_codon:yes stop_codon:yes gene_type:complete
MNASMILFGICPLIIFVILDTFASVKTAVAGAVIFALVELIYTLVFYKRIDTITVISLLFVAVFGFFSYKTDNSIYFKLQPVVFGVIFSMICLIMQALGKPILNVMMSKYQYMLPDQMRANMTLPLFQDMMTKVSFFLGWGLLAHALLVAYSVYYLSNWWWLAIRGVGLYIVMFACVFFAKFSR